MFRVLLKSVSDETVPRHASLQQHQTLSYWRNQMTHIKPSYKAGDMSYSGKQAQALKAGKIAMTLQDNKICFHALSELSLTESN